MNKTVLFNPLTLAEITGIVELLVRELADRLGIELNIDPAAEEYIARKIIAEKLLDESVAEVTLEGG